MVTERDAEGTLLAATGVQIPGVLDDVYAAGDRRPTLGPTFAGGRPTLAVWAPTAQHGALQLFDSPTAAPQTVPMRRDDRTGVWSVRGDDGAGPASTTGTGCRRGSRRRSRWSPRR